MNRKQSLERLQSRKQGIATRFAIEWTAFVAFLLLAGGALATPVAAASSPQPASNNVFSRTLTHPNASPEGAYGSWADASGNFIVVGAYNETANGYTGAGHVYVYSAKTGALLHTLTSPNAQTNGQFSGFGVAVSGNIVVVGAWNEAANGYAEAGHAYIFNAATGALLRTLTSPNPQTGGEFGNGIAVNGNIVVVGAWHEAVNGFAGAGRAYIYSADTGTLLRSFTSPNAQTGGQFGWAIALNGNTVDVSGWLETANGQAGAGHVYIFNIDTGALIRTLTSPNAQTSGGFGEAVAAIGNIVVVGAPFEAADGYAAAGHAYYYLGPPFSS